MYVSSTVHCAVDVLDAALGEHSQRGQVFAARKDLRPSTSCASSGGAPTGCKELRVSRSVAPAVSYDRAKVYVARAVSHNAELPGHELMSLHSLRGSGWGLLHRHHPSRLVLKREIVVERHGSSATAV